MIKIINEQMLDALRRRVRSVMSEKRFSHTLGVEREIERLSRIYIPDKVMMMRAAALLHDITKQYTREQHLAIMNTHGIDTDCYSWQSEKIYHSLTASLVIPTEYPEYADAELIHAVSVHTTGCADMSIPDKLLYLADYIEDTRTFEDCLTLRRYFWDGIDTAQDKTVHLDRTMLLSFDMTIRELLGYGSIISDKTTQARNSLILKLKRGD